MSDKRQSCQNKYNLLTLLLQACCEHILLSSCEILGITCALPLENSDLESVVQMSPDRELFLLHMLVPQVGMQYMHNMLHIFFPGSFKSYILMFFGELWPFPC